MSTATVSLGETPRTTSGVMADSKLLDLENDIVAFTDKLYSTVTDDRDFQRETKETTRFIDYLSGKQWADKARRSRSRPVLNKTRRHFIENVGLLTDLALDFQVKMFNRLEDFSEFEQILNQLCLHWAMGGHFEDRLYDVILYGLLHTGPAKVQWNSTLNGGMGDVQLVPVAPWQWGTLGAGNDPQDAECILYFPVVTREHLIRRFGATARRVQCDMEFSPGALQGQYKRPSHVSKESWGRLGQSLRTMMGVKQNLAADDSPYPMVMQKEFWLNDDSLNLGSQTICVGPADSRGRPRVNWAYMVEPGEKLYPRGRVIVTAGGCVMEDAPNPYWHAKKPFPVFRPFRLPWQMSGDCHDDITEVLTQRGWLRFADVEMNDLFATRQIKTGKFEWQRPNAIVKKPYTGDMFHFCSRSMDICVTPSHRMLVNRLPLGLNPGARKAGNKPSGTEGVCTAEELARSMTHHTGIPQTSSWEGVEIANKVFEGDLEERKNRMVAKAARVGRAGMTTVSAAALAECMGKPLMMTGDDYCAFMGAFLSEGWTGKWTVNVSQFKKSKGFVPYSALISRILERKFSHNGRDFVVSRKALRDHCQAFGTRPYNKFIPVEIMNATPQQIRIFWNYYVLGDGSITRKHLKGGPSESISTTSKQMAGQLMELAQKMGYSASVSTIPAKMHLIMGVMRFCRESYTVRLRRSKAMSVKFSKLHYDGMIYCASVPNGFLYTRRNGKPTWSGNSMMRPWLQMNDVINQILGGMQDYLKGIIEPTLVAPKGAFPAADWDALDPGAAGGKIKYNNNAPKAPEFAKRAEFPLAAVFQYVGEINKEFDMQSGASAMQQALGKKQVPGSDSLDAILSSRSLPVRVESRSLASFLTDGGGMVIADMLQFYSVSHRVEILGSKGISSSDYRPIYGQAIPAGMKPEDFVAKFQGIVRRDTLLASQKESKQQIAFALSKLGKLSDRNLFRILDQNFDFNSNQKELIQEAIIKLKFAAAGAAAQGKGAKK